ncbi:hypothetical protein LWM68_19505 [Niabella sp. W65]|nr:hypothetical protein [Niabella sp. W65]MCH7364754.1 hypothetical protein [Niabella sp. W65]ULT40600.1 hypothetical protein KRR40_38410 [Niabella sp. I65]
MNGIYYLHPPDNSIRQFNEKWGSNRISSNIISQVVQDGEGKIWIGTDHGGIALVDKKIISISAIF